ncbi:MAG: sarcosine oxidase subunit alpha family protein [Hyphomicrobiaceae bacterium]
MSTPWNRLPHGGRIDRQKPISFTFDYQRHFGFAGDTIASALLANGERLVGRSFKYHRPRGVYSAGIEEPNALVTVGTGNRREPNVPATMREISEGMVVESQNNWPSRTLDLMSFNQLAGKLISAGFYYKTFMGPAQKSWMTYEPFIRRAAGLGKASTEPDPDRYETRHAFTDVLVIGAGPAGLAAAHAAATSGARVVLVEQDRELGGSLLSEPVDSALDQWRAEVESDLRRRDSLTILTRTTAFGLYDHNTVGLLETRDHETPKPESGRARHVVVTVRAKAIVFATGAIERPLVFNNNDRPGVMLASAARTYVSRYAVKPGTRAIIVTNNDTAYRAAGDLARAGVQVVVADMRAEIGSEVRAETSAHGIEIRTRTAVVDVAGRHGVHAARLAEIDDVESKPKYSIEARSADLVAVSGGWSPAVHLTSHLGVKPVWRADIAAFVPGALPETQIPAGAVTGVFSLNECIVGGSEAGVRAATMAGRSGADPGRLPAIPDERSETLNLKPVWEVSGIRHGKAFVDIQNDVTSDDVRLAHREGYRSVEHLKRYTTLGMGTDQGKTSNVNALALMAELTGQSIEETGTTTFRPPYAPVTIGALAGRAVGAHFRPVRRSPLDDWHRKNGAELIEAGPWMRAWYYRWAGKTPAEAYIKEMQLVRSAVGISDVSTLGKIAVEGPDAAVFLDRVYVNNYAKLAVGKARYGVMLNDDGIAIDDGTTTRLGEHRYFMTTTTAQAGEVMSWLEFLLEAAWTDLDVHLASLTDQWGAMAVSGPKAREALALAFPAEDLATERLPYMGALETELEGVPVKILRLSFSGELAYEVYAPAECTEALWCRILEKAAPLGIKPYGLEALASLRIEKGHVAGLDLDHRNTLYDLGLGKMASKTKPFIGRELLAREAHIAKDRWSLVGLESREEDKPLRGGSILFARGDEIEGHGRGYITSVTWSTELNKFIALGLYKGGLTHEGDDVIAAFPLKDETHRLRIVSPHFIDRDGKRLHA